MKNWLHKFFKMKKEYHVDLIEVPVDDHEFSVPTLVFDIYVDAMSRVVGRCEYRFEQGIDLVYYGNVGYVIYSPYRGNNYAYKACVQLLALLKERYAEMDEVYITCNPDNMPSKRTIEKLGATYLQTVDVDPKHELFRYGEVQKDVYVVYLRDA